MPESLSGAKAKHQTLPGQPVHLFATLKFRLAAACLIQICAWFIAATLVSLEPFKPLPPAWRQALIALALIFSYGLYVRWLEQRTCQELHWRALSRHFLPGFGLAILMVSLGVISFLVLGYAQIRSAQTPLHSLRIFAELALLVLLEEILCRALFLRLLESYWGSWLALLISALIYGALHSFNHGAHSYTTLLMTLGQGICLGAAYLQSRNLGLCFGLHLGWNVAQGGIFSLPVSGLAYHGWLATQLRGPDWLTGGDFGIEISPPIFLSVTLLSSVLLIQARRGENWRAPQFRKFAQA